MNEPATGTPEINESPRPRVNPLIFIGIQIVIIAGLLFGVGYFGNQDETADIRSRASADTKGVSVSLSPAKPVITDGQFEITPLLVASSKDIGFAEIALEFNPNETQVVEVADGSQSKTLTLLIPPDLEEANTTGILRLTLGAFDRADNPGKTVQLPRVRFRTEAGKTYVGIRPEDSLINFLDNDRAEIYRVDSDAEAAIPEAEATPEPTPAAGSPKIKEVIPTDSPAAAVDDSEPSAMIEEPLNPNPVNPVEEPVAE